MYITNMLITKLSIIIWKNIQGITFKKVISDEKIKLIFYFTIAISLQIHKFVSLNKLLAYILKKLAIMNR